jgi:hypothetical protein
MRATAAEEEIMTLIVDISLAGTDAVADLVQALAEFEPDPAGEGSTELAAAACDTADDPQWIVWVDADAEAVWAAVELAQIGAGWHV